MAILTTKVFTNSVFVESSGGDGSPLLLAVKELDLEVITGSKTVSYLM